MANRRKHIRTPLATRIKITHPSIGSVVVTTRDVSDGGVYLVTSGVAMPPVGTVVEGQVQGPVGDLPVVKMRIVRSDSEGFGLTFCD